VFEDKNGQRSFSAPIEWQRAREPNAKISFMEEMFTYQFAMLVRRSLYKTVGPFREDLRRSQDYEMTLRLSRDAKAVYVPQAIFSLRMHAGTRGAGGNSFAAQKMARVGMEYGQKILAGIRTGYRLEEFTPTFALQWKGPRAERAALLQRMCVYGNSGMWG